MSSTLPWGVKRRGFGVKQLELLGMTCEKKLDPIECCVFFFGGGEGLVGET